MPWFQLLPTQPLGAKPVDFCDENAAGAIKEAERARFAEAELWQEGRYLFTLRRANDGSRFWTIYREANDALN